MKTYSKVFLAVAVACTALDSSQAVVLDLAPAEAASASVNDAPPADGYYSFVIDSGTQSTQTLDASPGSPGGSSFVPVSAVTASLPLSAGLNLSSGRVSGQPASGYRDFQVAQIIVIPEVTSVLPLLGVLGLAFGGRNLRRACRFARA